MTITDPIKLLKELRAKPEVHWRKRGDAAALRLFHAMAKRVPAYKDFLKRNRIDPKKVRTIADFKKLPTLDKDNYLRHYKRSDLCWDGKFSEKAWTIATTSGSTGVPFYFPRTTKQDEQYALTAELYLRTNFKIHQRSTLYIVGFPMGAWIGGVFTYEALQLLQKRGKYALSVITPGINKTEIIKAVKNLGGEFDQVLIGSYGPFLKDVIDEGIKQGLKWQDYNLGFIFSAEGFSETFRDYVIKEAGLRNSYTSTLNHYGTVDLGTMSYETPVSILARRVALGKPDLYNQIFGQITKLPTLTQFLPEQFYFEETKQGLVCSGDSGYPLVRYDLKDHGGVVSMEDMEKHFSGKGVSLKAQGRKHHLEQTIWNLPFVYVYERSDFSVSFFAFQVYPEPVRKALAKTEFHKSITGKFTMEVNFDRKNNQYLQLHVELKSDVKKSAKLAKKISEAVKLVLLEENSEYRRTSEEYSSRVTPRVKFWNYEHPLYFTSGIKQKWIKKNK